MRIEIRYTDFTIGTDFTPNGGRPKSILVFNYRFPKYLLIDHHKIAWVEKVKNDRPTILGQWKITYKDQDGYKF